MLPRCSVPSVERVGDPTSDAGGPGRRGTRGRRRLHTFSIVKTTIDRWTRAPSPGATASSRTPMPRRRPTTVASPARRPRLTPRLITGTRSAGHHDDDEAATARRQHPSGIDHGPDRSEPDSVPTPASARRSHRNLAPYLRAGRVVAGGPRRNSRGNTVGGAWRADVRTSLVRIRRSQHRARWPAPVPAGDGSRTDSREPLPAPPLSEPRPRVELADVKPRGRHRPSPQARSSYHLCSGCRCIRLAPGRWPGVDPGETRSATLAGSIPAGAV